MSEIITKEWLQKYIQSFKHEGTEYDGGYDRLPPVAKRIECADGFSMSVQGNYGAYCSPRRNFADWHQVEVGFPSEKPIHFAEHIEREGDDYTDSVYPYTPIALVVAEINERGGILNTEGGAE